MAGNSKPYRTNILTSVLGISRSTLRYYEHLGIISPTRNPGSNYREYTEADINAVFEAILMKNAGYQASAISNLLSGNEMAPSAFAELCVQRSQSGLDWAIATHDRFQSLARLISADFSAAPELVIADEWLVCYDGCEEGFDYFESDEAQKALLDALPVSTFAAIVDASVTDPAKAQSRWGRAIPVNYARSLLDEKTLEAFESHAETETFGGSFCLAVPYRTEWTSFRDFDTDGTVCARLSSSLKRYNLKQSGPIIAPEVLPICGIAYSNLICLSFPTESSVELALPL